MSGELHEPQLAPVPSRRVLEEVLYERLVELIDFDAMYQLEQLIAFEVGELEDLPDDQIADAAKAMVDRALRRLVDDPRRYVDLGPGPFPE